MRAKDKVYEILWYFCKNVTHILCFDKFLAERVVLCCRGIRGEANHDCCGVICEFTPAHSQDRSRCLSRRCLRNLRSTVVDYLSVHAVAE